MPSESEARHEKQATAVQARQILDIFHEISTLLVRCPTSLLSPTFPNSSQNADLDRKTLSICISLIENGANPEALAVSCVWLYLTREASSNYDTVSSQRIEERRRGRAKGIAVINTMVRRAEE
jgi:mitotic-spindle organizing protein 1